MEYTSNMWDVYLLTIAVAGLVGYLILKDEWRNW